MRRPSLLEGNAIYLWGGVVGLLGVSLLVVLFTLAHCNKTTGKYNRNKNFRTDTDHICLTHGRLIPCAVVYLCATVPVRALGGRGGPKVYPWGGEMGSDAPPQAPIFSHFSFVRYFSLVFMGIRRTCGHALRT